MEPMKLETLQERVLDLVRDADRRSPYQPIAELFAEYRNSSANNESTLRKVLLALYNDAFTEDESRLCLMVGNGPGMTNNSKNAKSLNARCDRIGEALKTARQILEDTK